jgi:hypothetical protein
VRWLGVDVRHGEGTIMMALFGLLESEEELKKVHYPATIFMFRRPCALASPQLSYAS